VLQTNLDHGKAVWNETYSLPVHVKEHQCLTAIMYDHVRALTQLFANLASHT
jgi:hypothetical protein